ncbi:Inhibitor of vertebrate lysozyme (Ivy) [Humidesulfovibrio mexicanus]|uniref:Inhibitor of vertebrate lysozyme (Ivy) n=2 Tax=Humidesulfovibrio mexicanus TaxID=147047 RepID=A0A238ZYU3_9BACT|nr:Inhibitor of vertebrate lysozyme (Ivy) [Humidesulfovibrio mexicanus]
MRSLTTAARRAARFLVVILALLGLCASGCAPQQPAQPAPPAVQAAPQRSVSVLGTLTGKHGQPLTGHDIRNTPPFSTAWRALLRRSGKSRETWLIRFDGPQVPVRLVSIGGAEYLRVEGCKANACAAGSVVVLYCEKEKATYALLKQNGESLWLGDPPDALKEAFAQLGTAEAPK